VLFVRRRDWTWGLLPLAYAAVVYFTGDVWSAAAAFLLWGVYPAGFLTFGRGWWKGLALVTVAVVYVYVLAPQPQIAFGLIFLTITLAIATVRLSGRWQSLGLKRAVQHSA
jgi:hypothetical protein